MKRISAKLTILMAAILVSALPVFAAEGTGMADPGQQGQKDECLLVARNCSNSVDSIQQRIDRISREISKGAAVYTRDELRRLDSQLKDANRLLEELVTGGGS